MYEFYTEDSSSVFKKKKNYWKRGAILLGLFALFFLVASFIDAPKGFPAGEVVTIEKGETLNQTAQKFAELKVVRSAGFLESMIVILGGDKKIAAGDYVFEGPLNIFEIARRLSTAQFGISRISVTLFEGYTRADMARVLGDALSNFNEDEFLFLTRDKEGYLFPDTYYFFVTTDTKEVVDILEKTFEQKVVEGLSDELNKSDKSLEEIITMASIIEAEARDGMVEKQTISGILWKRIDKKMRLQVDATLKYITGRGSKDLTLTDLADEDPYNTYTHYGLPPGPIDNPGINSIKAALNPIDSAYYFYLHDSLGGVHYAKTFDEHRKNVALYIK